MKQLIHNGILVPESFKSQNLSIKIHGKVINLSPLAEEMAFRYVQKFSTDYFKDSKFTPNFMRDFLRVINLGSVKVSDINWSDIENYVEKLKTQPKDKNLLLAKKAIREANKEIYGYATVDGKRVAIANYMAEPAAIFLGRGKQPLRGRWKPAVLQSDITLNLSPDAPTPPGEWAGREFHPEEFWIAKWKDQLSGKIKYVWFADTAPLKQEKVELKFDNAITLANNIDKVNQHIYSGLNSNDNTRRKIATVAYLINTFGIRIGDESETESGTVGATSLKKSNITLNGDNKLKLHFLGKDSVLFDRELTITRAAWHNIQNFAFNGDKEIFAGITTQQVREFLSEALPGITPKIFRTYIATKTFKDFIENQHIPKTEDAKKLLLIEANMKVAELLNHQKTLPKRWQATYDKRMKSFQASKGEKRQTMENRLKIMRMNKTYNLQTSLTNYIDPRVIVAYCKKMNYDISNFYSKNLLAKFKWAM